MAPGGRANESVQRQRLNALREERGRLREALRAERSERRRLAGQLRAAEKERDRWRRRSEALGRENEALKAQLEEARRAAKRQAAPFGRRRRKAEPKRPGRKVGHAAARRPIPPHIDEEIQVPLECCPDCGGAVERLLDLTPQVVMDLPEVVKLLARRYHGQSGWCRKCRKRVRSRHPGQSSSATGAAGVQLGPRVLSLAMDLRHRVGVTFRKICGIFELFFGLSVSAGALARAEQRIAKRSEASFDTLLAAVRAAQVAHSDETGWYITWADRKAWLWVFALVEPRVTLFVIRTSRGSDVVQEVLGEDFAGVLCVDGWAAYLSYACRKGQCHAHLLRRCKELLEVQKQGAARFPHAVLRVLRAGLAVKELAAELDAQDVQALTEQVQAEMQAVLEGQIKEPANLRFAKHLVRHQEELFTYLEVPELGPTNNLAERELRPAVILRKLSAGNRTMRGAHAHEVLASLSRTAERNGKRLADLLPDLLRARAPGYLLPLLAPAGALRCPQGPPASWARPPPAQAEVP